MKPLAGLRQRLAEALGPAKPGPRFRVVCWGSEVKWAAAVEELRQALAKLARGALDEGEVRCLALSLVRGQRCRFGSTEAGSWAVCRRDRALSPEARRRFIDSPTCLGIAILSRVAIDRPHVARAIPGLRPALAAGMQFLTQAEIDSETAPILVDGRVADMLRLDRELCPDLSNKMGIESPREPPTAQYFSEPTLGRNAKISVHPLDWRDVDRVVSHPEGRKMLLVSKKGKARVRAHIRRDGECRLTCLGVAVDASFDSSAIAPWGGHYVTFAKSYSHTDCNGERNIYGTTALVHELPSGRTVRAEPCFSGDSTASVQQVLWDTRQRTVMLDCISSLKLVPLWGEAECRSVYARQKGNWIDCNYYFTSICRRPHIGPEIDGVQFIASLCSSWRSFSSTAVVVDVASGRQWFLDDLVWRPWPEDNESRQENVITTNRAIYDSDGLDILVLDYDGMLRTWSVDGFQPGPTRDTGIDYARGMLALPGGKVAVWDQSTLVLDRWWDRTAEPIRWKAEWSITGVYDLSKFGLLGVLSQNLGDTKGNTFVLMALEDGAVVWDSHAHIGPVLQAHPYRDGLVIKDKQERWFAIGCEA